MNCGRSRHPVHQPTHDRRRAFTLLELMLALALSAVLVAAVASMLSLYLRAFDTGRGQVEEAQLARAVLDRLAEDVRAVPASPSAVDARAETRGVWFAAFTASSDSTASSGTPQDSAAAEPSDPDDTPLERLPSGPPPNQPRLIGDASRLLLDVRHAVVDEPAGNRSTPVDDENADSVAVDDLATVEYFLDSGRLSADATLAANGSPADGITQDRRIADGGMPDGSSTGLVRRQRPIRGDQLNARDNPIDDAPPTSTPSGFAFEAGTSRTDATTDARFNATDSTDLPAVESLLLVPEVAAIRFRYFDAGAWLTAWDSTAEGRLPRAVEVTLAVRPSSSAGSSAPAPDEGFEVEQFVGADGATSDQASPWITYRLVVPLPAAPPHSDDAIAEAHTGNAAASAFAPTSGGRP